MRRAILLTTLAVFCFSLLIARGAFAQPPNPNGAAPAQSSGPTTVYYCTTRFDESPVYFSAPFATDELDRSNIQEAYSQFLKQKYPYVDGVSGVICSISQSLTSAQTDKAGDEDNVKRSAHSVVETGWTYRGPTAALPPAAPGRTTSPAPGHAVAPAPAHPAVPVRTAAPAPPPVSAAPAAAPAQRPAPAAASVPMYYTLCRFQGQRDGHPIMYVTPIIQTTAAAGNINQDFYNYMRATYDIDKIQFGSGYCRQVSSSPDQQAFTMSTLEKQWAASKTEVTRLDWTDTPAEVAAINSKPAPAAAPVAAPAATSNVAAPSAPLASSTTASAAPGGGTFVICATSGGPGMDTYLTGAFQTTRVRHSPSGGNLVDQSILDDFYAYLKQKGYNFKPGSNYGCAVKPTEAEAKADEQKRQSGCSNCGKIVETGWKPQ
jgi:hypothetical protein